MNSLITLQEVQYAYLTYVHTFQKFKNSVIRDWVAERPQHVSLDATFSQASRRFGPGDALEDIVA